MAFDTKSKQQLRERLESAGSIFKGETSCTCPIHRDRNPSAGIYQSENGTWRFKCQVCDGANMDIIGLEAHLSGVTPEEVIKRNAEPRPEQKMLTEDEIRQRFSVANGWKFLHEYHDTKGAITHFVACKYEGDSKKFLQMKRYGFNFTMGNSGKRPLFRLNKIKDMSTIVIVEGEKCVLALEHIGIHNGTTCMGGAKSVSTADLSPLKGKRIIIWADNDSAGADYARDLKLALEALDCKIGVVDVVPLMLEDGGDVADMVKNYLKDYSVEEIREEIQGTIDDTPINGYWEAFKRGHIADLVSGELKSLSVGWECLGETRWLTGGSVTTLCATAGVGKTWFVHDLSLRAHKAGIKVANIQLEEDKDYHIGRLMSSMLGINVTDPDTCSKEDLATLERHKDLVDEIAPIIICPDFEKCTLLNVANIVKEKAESGYKLIIVDSVSVAEKSERPWDDDQRFINIVKRETKKHKIRLILVTHPNTLQGKAPTMDNLSGGKAYQRLSQVVLWLSRCEGARSSWGLDEHPISAIPKDGNRTVTMLKGRNSPQAITSNTFLFKFSKGRFEEVGFCEVQTA